MRVTVCFLLIFPSFLTSPLFADAAKQTTNSRPDATIVHMVQKYLISLKNVRMDFTQTSTNGPTAKGNIRLKKPDLFKVNYTGPHQDSFTLTDGMKIEYYDSELGERTELPIPHVMDILLFDTFDNVRVIRTTHNENRISITVEYDDAQATIYFQESPIVLLSWEIHQNNTIVSTIITKIEELR